MNILMLLLYLNSLAILITDFLSRSLALDKVLTIDWPHFLHVDQDDDAIVLRVSLA